MHENVSKIAQANVQNDYKNACLQKSIANAYSPMGGVAKKSLHKNFKHRQSNTQIFGGDGSPAKISDMHTMKTHVDTFERRKLSQ